MSGGIGFVPVLTGAVEVADGGITNATLATDSVDANAVAADAVAEIQSGLATSQDVTDILAAISGLGGGVGAMQRSADSGDTLMDGTEQTLYEITPSSVAEIGGGMLVIPTSSGAAFTLKIYAKNKSGGSYVDITPGSVQVVEGSYVLIGPGITSTVNQKRIPIPRFNRYGFKVTLQQGTIGAGYVTVSAEFFDTIG